MPGPLDGQRVQAPDVPDAEDLRPAPLPPDTFTGAPRPVQDNRMADLADALGSFNDNLKQFGRAYSMSQRVHADKTQAAQAKLDNDAAQNYIASKTPGQIEDDFKAGNLPHFQTGVANQLISGTRGQWAATQLGTEVQQKVGNGDINWQDGSAQAYLEKRGQEVRSGLDQNDNTMMRTFGEGYNNLFAKTQQNAVKANIDQHDQDVTQAASTQVEMALQRAQAANMTPAQTWDELNKVRSTVTTLSNLKGKDLDPIIMSALDRRFANAPDWVQGVANAPRTDIATGQSIPSIGSKAEYLNTMNSWQQRAYTAKAQQDEQVQKGLVDQAVSQTIENNPDAVSHLPPTLSYQNRVTGAQGQVTTEQAKTDWANKRISADTQAVASGAKTAAQVQDEQLDLFSRAGIKQNQWAEQLNSVAKGAANPSTLTNPNGQANAASALSLYGDLAAKNPAYLKTLVGGDASKFYDAALLQQRVFNKSPAEALQAAQQYVAAPTDKEGDALRSQKIRQSIDNSSKSLFASGGFLGIGSSAPKNLHIAQEDIAAGADSLVKINGMDPDTAVKTAAQQVSQRYANVNGYLVPTSGFLPKQVMEPTMQGFLQDWSKGAGASLNMDPGRLALAPADNTGRRFVIVDNNSGLPVGSRGGMTYVTSTQLAARARVTMEQQQHDQAAETDAAAAKAAADAVETKDQNTYAAGRMIYASPAAKAAGAAAHERMIERDTARNRKSFDSLGTDMSTFSYTP